MSHLVDTQVALWVVGAESRLGATARRSLTTAVTVHVSAVSLLEITIKSMLGRLTVPDDLEQRLIDQGFEMISLTPGDATTITAFPGLVRHDPFDRALLAQASARGLRFLTSDRVLLDLGLEWVDDATQ